MFGRQRLELVVHPPCDLASIVDQLEGAARVGQNLAQEVGVGAEGPHGAELPSVKAHQSARCGEPETALGTLGDTIDSLGNQPLRGPARSE